MRRVELLRRLSRLLLPLLRLCAYAPLPSLAALAVPPPTTVNAMWPFIEAAIHKPSPSTLLQAELKKAAMDAASTAASDALATASYYTTSLYDTLWSYAPPAPPLIKGRLKDLGMVA
jgi:hypothetical protein